MTNQLCDAETPDCIGFAASTTLVPYGAIRCRAGDLVVEDVTAAQPHENSLSETPNTAMATATTYLATDITLTMTNPWGIPAIVWVDHEFLISVFVSDTDQWSMLGEVSISGGTLFSGATALNYTFDARDGTAFANSDTKSHITRHDAASLMYTVGAAATFTITQHARFEATTIRGGIGGGRVVETLADAMRAIILPKQS